MEQEVSRSQVVKEEGGGKKGLAFRRWGEDERELGEGEIPQAASWLKVGVCDGCGERRIRERRVFLTE